MGCAAGAQMSGAASPPVTVPRAGAVQGALAAYLADRFRLFRDAPRVVLCDVPPLQADLASLRKSLLQRGAIADLTVDAGCLEPERHSATVTAGLLLVWTRVEGADSIRLDVKRIRPGEWPREWREEFQWTPLSTFRLTIWGFKPPT